MHGGWQAEGCCRGVSVCRSVTPKPKMKSGTGRSKRSYHVSLDSRACASPWLLIPLGTFPRPHQRGGLRVRFSRPTRGLTKLSGLNNPGKGLAAAGARVPLSPGTSGPGSGQDAKSRALIVVFSQEEKTGALIVQARKCFKRSQLPTGTSFFPSGSGTRQGGVQSRALILFLVPNDWTGALIASGDTGSQRSEPEASHPSDSPPVWKSAGSYDG